MFERRKRHLERYVEIGRILGHYGWQSLLRRSGLADLFHVRGLGAGVPPGPVQVRRTIEELGPTFIKLGQVLSTRPDLIPPEYILELQKLQDEAPPVPTDEIKRVIEGEFGKPASQLFTTFEDTPLAAASLGQAHTATLKDGREVVVKVQRPGIRQVIDTDLEIVAGVAHFLERHIERFRAYNLSDLVDEFSITLRQELDYTREGRNGDELKRNLAELEYVRVADTIWDYSTSRVLTSERISGVKINDLGALEERGYDPKQMARNLWRAFLKMVFIDGFFHGDPHPGNLAVLPGNVIGLLDYGMVGRLDRELKNYVTILLSEYVQQDSHGFADTMLEIGSSPSDLNRKEFVREIDRLLRQYYGAPLREIQMGEALTKSVRVSAKFRIRMPANLGLLVKVIAGIEGINRTLDPEYDMAQEAKPFISRSVIGEFSPTILRSDLLQTLLNWKSLALAFPLRVNQVLDRMSEGSFRIIFRHEGLERPMREIDKSANRLSLAMIAAASIIGSSLILSAEASPLWRGYSVVGLLGFLISSVFAVWLIISIIRGGKLW